MCRLIFINATSFVKIQDLIGFVGEYIDGLHLTHWRPRWRYNTKEYVINFKSDTQTLVAI